MKRFLALFLAICLCFGCVPATHAHATEIEADPQAENSWRYENGELIEEEIPEAEDVTVGEDGSLGDIEDVEENPDLFAFYPSESKALGIDVSEHQGQINWDKVAAAGIKFAIIRCGYGQNQTSQDDDWFTYNISECNRVGIPFGLYLYSYAKSTSAAQGEADHAIRLINVAKQYSNFKMPMYYDLEENSQFAMGASAVYDMAKAFHDRVEASTSWPVGVYANTNWFTNVLTYDWYQDQPLWCAQYNSSCQYNGDYDIWQYSSSGSVNGISGRVDMNYSRVSVATLCSYTTSGTVAAPETKITTNKSSYSSGEAIVVDAYCNQTGSWFGLFPASATSNEGTSLFWFNLKDSSGTDQYNSYPVNVFDAVTKTENRGYNWNSTYQYDNTGDDGSVFWGDLKPGNYEIRIVSSGYATLAKKAITVTSANTTTSLSTDKTTYTRVGNTVDRVMVTVNCTEPRSWVGIFKESADPLKDTSLAWFYCYNNNGYPISIFDQNWQGAWPDDITTGKYKVVLLNAARTKALKTVTVTFTAPSVSANNSTYCVNQDIYVSTNYAEDGWVGLYKDGEEYGTGGVTSLYWYYLSEGGRSNTNIFGFHRERPGDYSAAKYNIILFEGEGYTELAKTTVNVVNCTDGNKDHKCDYCGTSMGTHAAASGSHNCSYCGQAVSTCNANSSTVNAKYLKSEATCQSAAVYYKSCSVCGKHSTSNATFTSGSVNTSNHVSGCTLTWTQTATQHTQKYSKCGTVKIAATNHTWNNGTCSVCGYVCNLTTDTDKNHKCDTCGKVVSTCADGNKDHFCDTCGAGNQGTHAPAAGSHICDYCKQKASDCIDTNPVDGKCDVCGVSVSHTCVDENTDHACDICSASMGTHAPAQGSHNCEYCGKPADTGCVDAQPKDHKCDICGANVGDPHAAAEGSHNCAYCGGKVTDCDDKTGDGNHSCDICGAADITKCADGDDADHNCDECNKENVSQCADGNNDHNCDQCQAPLTGCTDSNGDDKCDICGAAVSKTSLNIAKITVEVGEGLLVTATSNTEGDWVGIYEKGVIPADGENAAYYWYFVDGTDSESGKSWTNGNTYNIFTGVGDDNHKDLKGLPAGDYDVVLLSSGYTEKNRVTVTINPVAEGEKPAPSLSVTKSVYAYGEEVRYTATSYKSNPWVGLYKGTLTAESEIPTSMSWQYVQGRNGTEDTWGPQNPGDYTIILFDDYSNYTVDKVVHFTVGETDAPALATDKDEYEVGKPILVTTNYMGGSAWVGLYQKDDTYGSGENADAAIFWYYLTEEGNPVNILETRDENGRGGDYGVGEFKIILFSSDYNEVISKNITVKEAHTCEDKNPADHNCDICGDELSDCKDENGDHNCDICGDKLSDCKDGDNDHNCDVCGEPLSECSDQAGDGDHDCDTCGKPLSSSKCNDENGDNKCDECGATMCDHKDEDNNHNCDACQKPVSDHKDETGDHNCDICGDKLSECKDENGDHNCDICGDKLSECKDENGDHNCDICGNKLSECKDENGDHNCDTCGDKLSDCKDGDKDHNCDTCGDKLSDCKDEDKDGKCDICEGDVETEPTEPEETEPKPTEPEETEPKPTDPEETEPKPTDPEETEPKPTEPEAEEDVIRLAGEDRFDTAFIVADKMKKELGIEKFNTIIVASGKDFADALSGSYLAAVKNAPILLSYKDKQNQQVMDYIRENLAEGGTVYILGGPKAVPESMENALADLKVKRLAGENRFDTNTEILKEVGVPADETVLVCTGSDFADCLSGSAVGKPIMLVYKKLMESQKNFLPELDNNYCIIGGENAVNKNIEATLKQYGEVERLAGAHRYETSVLVADKFFEDPDSAVLAYAKNYPDGLCGGALAVTKNAPLLLTDSKYFSYAAEYAEKNGIAFGIVLGGDKLISDKAVETIFGK